MSDYLRTDGPIRGRIPRTDQPVTYRVSKPDIPDPARGWQNRAACRDEDPEIFFPIGDTGPALLQIEDAKAVCRRCDVADRCLDWAMAADEQAGVWGGMSESERRSLKQRIARASQRARAKDKQAAA